MHNMRDNFRNVYSTNAQLESPSELLALCGLVGSPLIGAPPLPLLLLPLLLLRAYGACSDALSASATAERPSRVRCRAGTEASWLPTLLQPMP